MAIDILKFLLALIIVLAAHGLPIWVFLCVFFMGGTITQIVWSIIVSVVIWILVYRWMIKDD